MGVWRIISPFTTDDINEVSNSSFGLGTTTNWSTAGTIAASAEQQWRGKYSGKVTVPASTTLAAYAITLANQNTTYYLRCRVWVSSNWNGGNITLTVAAMTGATPTFVKIYTHGTDPTETWVEIETTVTVATDVAGTLALVSSATPTAGRIVYFDGLYASSVGNGEYFNGDDEMAYWVGARYTGTARMDFRNRAHGQAVDLESINVYITLGMDGLDFPQLQNRHIPRALGIGSEYQNLYVGPRFLTLPILIDGTGDFETMQSRRKAFIELIKPNRVPGNNQPFILQYYPTDRTSVPIRIRARLESLDLDNEPGGSLGVMRLLVTDPFWYEQGDQYSALTRYSSLSAKYILGWLNDGTGFSALGNTGVAYPKVITPAENGDVYVGGFFLNWDGNADADYIVRYNRSAGTWTALFATPANNYVKDIIILDDGDLVITGDFTTLNAVTVNGAGRWDGTTVTAFGTGFSAEVETVVFDYQRGFLYFGGAFTTANGVAHSRIVKYKLSTGTFIAMDGGANGKVNDMYLDQATGDLFVVGAFTTVGGTPLTVNYIARWDHSELAWKEVGRAGSSGVNAEVRAITGNETTVYFGGAFTLTTGGSTATNYIAKYKIGAQYITLLGNAGANGVDDDIHYVAWDNVLNKLFLSGEFESTFDNSNIRRLAFWNGSTFEPIGISLPSNPIALAYARHPSGDYYFGYSTSGTVTVPSALNTVTNNGTTEAKPIFYFDSLGTAITTANARLDIIANRTTGKQINFNGLNLIEGTLIIVDTARQRVYRLVGQTLTDITPGLIRRDSDWSTFALAPGPNEIMISAPDVTGTPTITPYVLWRNRHHSISGTAT